MIFAGTTISLAEDNPVRLNVPNSMNLLIDLGYYEKEVKNNKKEIIILNDLIEQHEDKVANLFQQNKICSDANGINKQQAIEYKKEYLACTEELIKARKIPWWKFDLKSVVVGLLFVLLI